MYTIVTVCPNCSTSQLADGHLIGRKVKCAKCELEFLCNKKAGPVFWVREADTNSPQDGFIKKASKVLFRYGIAVPLPKQQLFLNHLGHDISEGTNCSVTMKFGKRSYPVTLAFFKNKRGEPSLHFKWKLGDGISLALQTAMPRAYKHFVTNGNAGFLDGEAVSVSLSDNMSVFELKVRDYGDERFEEGELFDHSSSRGNTLNKETVRDLLSELLV